MSNGLETTRAESLSLGLKEKINETSLKHIATPDGKKPLKTMWSCHKDPGINLKEAPTGLTRENWDLSRRTTAKDCNPSNT